MKRNINTRVRKVAALVLFSAASITMLLALPRFNHIRPMPRAKTGSSILLDTDFNAPFFAIQTPPG